MMTPEPGCPRFIAFISREEEISHYTALEPASEFVFASFSSIDSKAVCVRPQSLDQAIAHFASLHRQSPFTAVLNRKEKCVVQAARLALALGLPPITMQPDVARDKYAMRCRLNGNDSFPRVHLIRDEFDLEAVESSMFPCVLKPRFGFNSRSVVLVVNRCDLQAAYVEQHRLYSSLPKQDATSADFVVEELIQGSEHTVETLVKDGKPLFHLVSDKLAMTPPFFVEIGDNMPTALASSAQEACRGAAERAIARMGICNAWTHTEVRWNGYTAVVVESAARMGGGYFEELYREVYGIDRMQMMHALFLGHAPGIAPEPRIHAAARRVVVYGSKKMRVANALEAWFDLPNVRLVSPSSVGGISREIGGPPFEFNNTLFEFIALGSTAVKAQTLADRLVAHATQGINCW
jgi:hypothetical protein